MLQCYQRKQVRECRAEAVAGRCSHLAQSVRDGERERGGKERLDPHVYRLLSQRLVFGLLVQRPLRFPTNPQKKLLRPRKKPILSDESHDRQKTQCALGGGD